MVKGLVKSDGGDRCNEALFVTPCTPIGNDCFKIYNFINRNSAHEDIIK